MCLVLRDLCSNIRRASWLMLVWAWEQCPSYRDTVLGWCGYEDVCRRNGLRGGVRQCAIVNQHAYT